ncbi:hypothetical protein QOZ96_000038 [Brevundimonas nasdae]|uniref:hypothetical protein n=1 Tax=Brevundimonas nasdae TaxID=172043 RepID=UPI001914BDAB|nr:hypothetical protein [Brevundimonas nasdae]MBK6023466.1 hypothetical protein [Brevundimonas nasdae]MDQ0450113.1 hypothetical protein [Brevundimonas nasdae]
MSIDGLVTFVGLVVALFALATDSRRKALLLRRGVTLTLTVVFGAAVLYLELFSVWAPECGWEAEVCRVLVLDGDKPWITPQQAAFVLVLVWLGLVLLNLQGKALGTRHLPRLLALATALAEEKRFSELNRVIQPHLGLIAGVSSGALTASDAQKQAATALERLLYRQRGFVQFIAMERPKTAVEMMAVEGQIVFEFAEQILRTLAENTDSPLFTEVYENQNTVNVGYDFPDHNTYLSFLFGDARQAERLGAWEPVMEAALVYLAEAKDGAYQTYLSGTADRFQNEERWRDRTFVAIRYLDLMVGAAMRQGVHWHMWLFYTTHLTKSLLELYVDPRKDEEVFDEWPTRNAYLLSSIFGALTDWIEAIDRLPADSPHLVLQSNRAVTQNGNIPKSAIIALGDCLRQVLLADAVSDRFKRNLSEIVFRCIAKLPRDGDKRGFRESLVASVLAGGPMMQSDHLGELRGIFEREDHILRGRLKDFEEALDAAIDLARG